MELGYLFGYWFWVVIGGLVYIGLLSAVVMVIIKTKPADMCIAVTESKLVCWIIVGVEGILLMFNTVGFFAKIPILIAAPAAIILFDSLIGKLFAPKEKRKEMEKGYIFAFIPLLLLVLLGAISLKASLTVTTQAQDWYKSVRTEQTAKDMHIEGPYLVFDKVGTEYYPKLRHYGTGDVDCLPLLRFLTDDCKTVLVISKSEVAHSATYGSASGSRIRQMRLTVDVYDRQSGKRMGSFMVLGASVPNSIGNSGDRDNYPPYRDVIKAAEEYAEAHNRY